MKQILIVLLVGITACTKTTLIQPDETYNGPVQFSNALTVDILNDQKAGKNGYYPWQSDTIYAARTPNYAVLMYGNSLLPNWRYYGWESTWKGIPVINRAVGGKTDRERIPFIQKSTFDYTPKVWVYYGEENVFLRPGSTAAQLTEAIKYFDSTYKLVRRKYPNIRIVINSMMTCPALYEKRAAIDSFNTVLYKTAMSDPRAYWVEIRDLISYTKPQYYRPDKIHLEQKSVAYSLWAGRLKPIVQEALKQ